jgi:hypothetical protein
MGTVTRQNTVMVMGKETRASQRRGKLSGSRWLRELADGIGLCRLFFS